MSETVVRYEPRGGARDLLEAQDNEVLISGPAGTGKSLAMLFKAHYTSLLVPGCASLIVRQTHTALTGSTLVTFERDVIPHALASGAVTWFGGSPRKPAAYTYENGSTIVVGGLDRPEKFLSTDFSRVYIDEANQITLTAFETLVTRLRGQSATYRQIVAACNPDHPNHWLKLRCQGGATRMLHSRHEDNPLYVNADGTLTPDGRDYMQRLDALSGVRRLRYRDGIWAAAEGLVYEEWRDDVHLVDRFYIPKEWPRYVSVDFGYTNPTVVQWWALDGDGRAFMYREIYKTRQLVEDTARQVKSLIEGWEGEPWPVAVICDHDAEDRKTLEKHSGLATVGAFKAVKRGVEAVQARLRPAGDGRPRLFLLRDSLVERDAELAASRKPAATAEEVGAYVWAQLSSGQGYAEVPVKRDDHGVDAMRYLVAHLDIKDTAAVGAPLPRPGAQGGRLTSAAERYTRSVTRS